MLQLLQVLLIFLDLNGLIDWILKYIGNISVIIQTILTFVITILTGIVLVFAYRAWKGLRKEEEDRQRQIDKLEDIALTSERQLEVLEQSLEATREVNNLLFQFSTTKETEPEKEKILERIVAIEKARRQKAIMPKFVKKGWASNFSWINLLNIGEPANDIHIQLFKGTDMTKNPQIINTFAPNEYIEKKERLKIRLDAEAVPNIFTLLIIFNDSDGTRYSQVIKADNSNLEIDEPILTLIHQK